MQLERSADYWGIAASGLCAIHCTLTPLFFAAQPLVHEATAHHEHGHGIWGMLDYLFLAISLLAVWYAASASRRGGTKLLLWVGWVCFALGLVLEHYSWARCLMYGGSAVLIITHLINFRQCRVPNPAKA